MRLYLVRHGKAERDSASGRDEDRALSRRGEMQAIWLGRALEELPAPHRPTRILGSPALRARDTARIIHGHVGGELRLEPRLGLGASPEEVLEVVIEGASEPALMVVGHNPTLEALAAILARDDGWEMRTGEAAVFEVDAEPSMSARWRTIGRLRLEHE